MRLPLTLRRAAGSAMASLAALTVSVVIACTAEDLPQTGGETPAEDTVKVAISYGLDSLTYHYYEPLKAIKVFYYVPSKEKFDRTTLPILFAMHGQERNARGAVNVWKSTADEKGVIIIAPQFPQGEFTSQYYQLGGISNSTSYYTPRPTGLWTYQYIEKIFSLFVRSIGGSQKSYDLWGHSAGGQFTHRFLLNMKEHHCGRAVESNAGYYTVPDPEGIRIYSGAALTNCYEWPFSVKGMFIEDAERPYSSHEYDYMTVDQLKKYLGFDLTVHLGMLDTVTSAEVDPNLPTSAGALSQGKCRLERGRFFYARAKAVADSLGCPFGWKKVEVPASGHSSSKMVPGAGDPTTGAAYILYNDK